ncbi:MAG TPA: glycolate oxidase subunit GlcF [Rhizomicrobium sp.]|nr:glycolate oxidase subunit GlcF [Rhizomicrobium sp.]
MQTSFTETQLAKPGMRENERILRTCVHCGLCSATCPTYALLGDELDSPRGRIYLIKSMFETGRDATAQDALHIDRCLSCLACTTTCPSGVDYMHLVDRARQWIEKTYERPLAEKWMRSLLAFVLPRPTIFRSALVFARFAKPFARLMPGRIRAMLVLAPTSLPNAPLLDIPAVTNRRMRVALLGNCVQPVLAPQIDAATIRILTRHGCEVVTGGGCCGALTHHLGKDAKEFARANIDRWMNEIEGKGLDAIVVNVSGCGVHVKDYGHLLKDDPAYAAKAARIAALAKDPTEILNSLELVPVALPQTLKVAYHSACSLQHGQKIAALPKQLLQKVGFKVVDIPEGHLCCGSAGTYNILQPELSAQLRDRKVMNIRKVSPDIVAAGNIGCIVQIANDLRAIPVAHTIELLDWATGGPPPHLASDNH